MAETFKKLAQGTVPASITALFTGVSGFHYVIKHMRFANFSGANQTLTLYQDGALSANIILPTSTILAGGWAEFEGAILLEDTGTIRGIASTVTTLTYTIYGLEVRTL